MRRLSESATALLSHLLDWISEGVIVTDTEGTILAVNKAFIQITGYSKDEILGENPRFLKSHHHDSAFYHAMWKQLLHEGHWEGFIWNRRKNGEIYQEKLVIQEIHDLDRSPLFLAVFVDCAQSQLYPEQDNQDETKHLDPLTGLLSKFTFVERFAALVDHADQINESVVLILANLDHFQDINDGLGYLAGDHILQTISQKFKTLLHGHPLIARLGNDEFAFAQSYPLKEDKAQELMGELTAIFRTPLVLNDLSSIQLSASIGGSVFPEDAHSDRELFNHAGTAMHQMKRQTTQGGHIFYAKGMAKKAQQRMSLIQDILKATEQEEFFLQYQPQINLNQSKVTGVEALLRWQRLDGTMISPIDFIPLAEESGAMVPLGRWILRTACSQALKWIHAGVDLNLAVNISPVQIYRDDLLAVVEQILKDTGFPGDRLRLEITESMLIDNYECVPKLFNQLRDLGVSLAIDDFGTGYSSFSFLQHCYVEEVKIDRSFIVDLERSYRDRCVVEAMTFMAQSMVSNVVVEGVETQEQLEVLKKMDADLAVQGFFYSRALDPEHIANYVTSFQG